LDFSQTHLAQRPSLIASEISDPWCAVPFQPELFFPNFRQIRAGDGFVTILWASGLRPFPERSWLADALEQAIRAQSVAKEGVCVWNRLPDRIVAIDPVPLADNISGSRSHCR
jgi:hypothetical protein